jgi:hypothetical protein
MEEENALVAFSREDDLTKEHTHMQISPVDMVGFCTWSCSLSGITIS